MRRWFFLGLLPYLFLPWASAHHPAYNWGNVSSVRDLIDLISRKSYGGRRLVSTPGYGGGSPFARIIALGRSFGPVAAVLIWLGALQAYRSRRWYFWFTLIAFVFTGPFFVWISNLNIATAPSALFVLQRFFLLSHVVLAPLLAFGVLLIAELIASFALPLRSAALPIGATACLILVATTVKTHYRKIDQSHNSIARRFGEDVLATAEPDSVLLARGDGIVIPLIYLQVVEGVRQDVIVIAMPLLVGDWYIRQLKEQHPQFIIPFDHYDGQSNNLKMLVEANSKRRFAIVGTLSETDHSLDRDYGPYQHGLLSVIEPKSKRFSIQEMVDDNEQLRRDYHFPTLAAVRRETFEKDILDVYAGPALRLGREYERVGAKEEARACYERSLAISPDLSSARQGLARVR